MVKSILDPTINYPETKNIDKEDKNYNSQVYEITLFQNSTEINIVLGQPNNFGTITNNINGLLSKFLPKIQGKKVMEVAAEYGLDMDAKTFEQQILASADMSNVDAKWNQIQSAIVTKYKENLDKFLTDKFPDTKVQKLGAFRPETSSNEATQQIKKVSSNYGPGTDVPKINPQEKKTQTKFEVGR